MAQAARDSDEQSRRFEVERKRGRKLDKVTAVMGAGWRRRAGGDGRGPWTADGVDGWG
jgi:hypothetical protein